MTETFYDLRGWVPKALGKPVTGVVDRESHNRATMEATLDRLAAVSESST